MFCKRWFVLAVSPIVLAIPTISLFSAEEASKQDLSEQLPRIHATEPKDALKTIKVAKGFSLDMVASEPLVADPVDACFDENGRMFVAEMHGYPFSQEPTKLFPSGGGKKDAGVIRLLEDTNGDGKYDKSTVYADKMSWPTSVCCYNGGIYVLAPPHIYYFKDTDGDNKADQREIVYTGFKRDNVQGLANNLKWGLDNRIYLAGGRNGGNILHEEKLMLATGRLDMRFNPKKHDQVDSVSGGLQFGHSMDNWGNRFVCSNSNHILQVVFPYRYLKRNPYLALSNPVRTIAFEGASSQVYRTSPPEPWRIVRQKWRAEKAGFKLVKAADGSWKFVALKNSSGRPPEYPVGFFTSATGVTIYRGAAYPSEFQGNAFIGDVGGNLAHRKTIKTEGVTFQAKRADKNVEFITSTDTWFRPVNFVNAPDGTLYVLDMYRETIEHPYSIPPEIKEHLFLESGDNRGRIYRIVAPKMKHFSVPKLGSASVEQLVSELNSPNVWNRQTAQRLLWERQDKSAAKPLRKLLQTSNSSLGKLHALWTLAGLNALTPKDVIAGLSDSHSGVREHAVRLAEPFAGNNKSVMQALLGLTNDQSPRVRFQLALSLGEVNSQKSLQALTELAKNSKNSADIKTAVLTSVSETSADLAVQLLSDENFMKDTSSRAFLLELAIIVGSNAKPQPAATLLATVTKLNQFSAIQQSLLDALGEGLSRRGSSLPLLLKDKAVSTSVKSQVKQLFDLAAETAGDSKTNESMRLRAVKLLALSNNDASQDVLADLLNPRTSQTLQLAAVESLSEQGRSNTGALLIENWGSFSPQLRKTVVDELMLTKLRVQDLLQAIEDKDIPAGEIEQAKKQTLMNHPDSTLRVRSRKLFEKEIDFNRAKVVSKYQASLKLTGLRSQGQTIFKKQCAVCHRVGKEGHKVGPDLTSVKNKSAADLIIAVLDPNRERQPNFTAYTVVTEQGKIYNGIIAAETAANLTLRRAEGKEDVILRSNIDILTSNGKSLMPEGLEKDLTPQQLADVIEYITSIQVEKKK